MKFGRNWMIPAALILAAALRLAAATGFARSPLVLHPVLEDLDYRSRALQVHEGEGLGRTIPRGSALYPVLVSQVPGVPAGAIVPLAMAQCACELGTVLLLALLVRRRWGVVPGAAAAALYALDPLGAFFAARFSPVAPATLLFVAAVYLWDRERSADAPALPLALGTGLVVAAGFLLTPLVFLCLLAVRLRERINAARRTGGRPAWLTALLPVAFVLAFAAGIMARHAGLAQGAPILSWGAGPALDRALDPATGGTPRFLRPPAWITDVELRRRTVEELGRPITEIDLYRTAAARGRNRALANPLSTIGVLLSKAAATLGAWPIPDALSPAFLAARTVKPFAWLAWSFAGLLAVGAAGYRFLRGDPLRSTLVQALAAVALASLLGPASAASRQAALPLLAALGGGWLAGAGSAGSAGDAAGARFRGAPFLAFALALLVSIAAVFLGPARTLRNPSEDLRLLAGAFEQTMNTRQAVPLLEEAVKRDGRNPEARVELARAYLKDALPAAATEQLETAYRADSTNADVMAALAAQRQASGQTGEALALMQRLLQLHPRNAGYLREYGTWLGQAGRMNEAESALSAAVQLDPADQAATRSLQEVVNMRMSLENALFPGELRSDSDPAFGTALARIVEAMEGERWARADSILSWAESTHPQLATTHWMRAGFLARRGDIPGSIAALERCQRIAPGRPAVVTQLTRLYVESHQQAKVPPLFRESLAAVAADSVVTRQLKMMARQIGLPL